MTSPLGLRSSGLLGGGDCGGDSVEGEAEAPGSMALSAESCPSRRRPAGGDEDEAAAAGVVVVVVTVVTVVTVVVQLASVRARLLTGGL